jgi:hypothetical protein
MSVINYNIYPITDLKLIFLKENLMIFLILQKNYGIP